jgi:hypothetical protein
MASPKLSLDQPPFLVTGDLSGEEIDITWNVSISLRHLVEYTDDFRAALALFDACNEGLASDPKAPWLRKWRDLAGRDAGMSLWHFGRTIEGVQELIGDHPILKTRTNPRTLKQARSLLERKFRMREQIRHAIAHRSDFFTSPQKARYHSIPTAPGVRETRWGQLRGRRFRYTVNGAAYYYDMNQETLDRLIEVRSIFFSAFVFNKIQ